MRQLCAPPRRTMYTVQLPPPVASSCGLLFCLRRRRHEGGGRHSSQRSRCVFMWMWPCRLDQSNKKCMVCVGSFPSSSSSSSSSSSWEYTGGGCPHFKGWRGRHGGGWRCKPLPCCKPLPTEGFAHCEGHYGREGRAYCIAKHVQLPAITSLYMPSYVVMSTTTPP